MQPSQQLVNEVKAGFIKQGTTLSAYCRENKIDGANVYRLLRGEWDGAKAKAIREELKIAAKVKNEEFGDS